MYELLRRRSVRVRKLLLKTAKREYRSDETNVKLSHVLTVSLIKLDNQNSEEQQ